jgi:hypothetical protein
VIASYDARSSRWPHLRASLSPRGYEKTLNAMKMNAFLGELCDARGVMNALSYNFSLFGVPGVDRPWGWQRSLDNERRSQAWVYRQMRDPAMPPGRFHREPVMVAWAVVDDLLSAKPPRFSQHLSQFVDSPLAPYQGLTVRVHRTRSDHQWILVSTTAAD